MAILPIITAPNPILKKKSLPVEVIDDELRLFLNDMIETMYHDRGIGLAAVQVGVPKRIFVMDLQEDDSNSSRPKNFFPLKIINPEIIYKSEEECIATEGCLSVPEQYIEVTRPEKVTIKYLDENSNENTLECDEWLARCVQHEIDHLDGKTLLDYVSPLKRDVMIRKLVRAKRQKI